MKTEILKVKGDWQEVVNDCRATVNKPPLGKEPSAEFKRGMMVCEHTPIRRISISFMWKSIAYWVAMHLKTPVWYSVCTTQRNDRQQRYDRGKAPQDAPVDFTGETNPQHLIDTSRKRLCYQASKETRELWEDYKVTIHNDVDEYVSWAMVPNCVYRGGCPEVMQSEEKRCRYYEKLLKEDQDIGSHDLRERYDAYNRIFYKSKNGKAD